MPRDGYDGMPGRDGEGVYKLAKRLGFQGSESEFLESLKGADGRDGIDGKDGSDGIDGRDGINGAPGFDGRDGRDGIDGIQGKQGPRGFAGPKGEDGWTASLAVVSDGERRVLEVVDWFGGQGTKPTAGLFMGEQGFVATAREATDIRGPRGFAGATQSSTLSVREVFLSDPGNLSYPAILFSPVTIDGQAMYEMQVNVP